MSESKVEILKWSDIKSKTMELDEYLELIKEKDPTYNNYRAYHPKKEVIKQIQQALTDISKNVKILAIGSDWCKDCSMYVPRMAKIIESVNNSNLSFRVLYGVMVDAMKKKKKVKWHEKRSPPEATDPKFDLSAIPTFFIFIDDGYCGRVIEGPKEFETLEEELLQCLQSNL